jgi:hypothetical protein
MAVTDNLTAELILNNILIFSSYLTGKALYLRYKAKPVNAVYRNNRFLL